jgi:hypothetical protein
MSVTAEGKGGLADLHAPDQGVSISKGKVGKSWLEANLSICKGRDVSRQHAKLVCMKKKKQKKPTLKVAERHGSSSHVISVVLLIEVQESQHQQW